MASMARDARDGAEWSGAEWRLSLGIFFNHLLTKSLLARPPINIINSNKLLSPLVMKI